MSATVPKSAPCQLKRPNGTPDTEVPCRITTQWRCKYCGRFTCDEHGKLMVNAGKYYIVCKLCQP